MAFSTQKDFFHVPFMNEELEYACNSCDCVKLKSYESTMDDRSWALGTVEKSRYFTDLVACRTPICKEYKKGSTMRSCARPGGVCSVIPEKIPCGDCKRNMECEKSVCFENDEMAKCKEVLQKNCELQHELDISYKCLESTIKERDLLHKRLEGVREMEQKINELQKNARCVGETQNNLIANLKKQCKCIDIMQDELRRSELKSAEKIKRLEESERFLRQENRLLKNELFKAHTDKSKMYRLQEENKKMCREVRKLQAALSAYDEQYAQLLKKVSTFKNQGYTFDVPCSRNQHSTSSRSLQRSLC